MNTTMKRCIALAMSAALALSITACGSSGQPSASRSDNAAGSSASASEGVQIPNPWQDFQSLEEAAKAVGFDFAAPETLEGFDKVVYQATTQEDDKIIEALYYSGEDQQINIRKAPGSENISGVYTQFDKMEQTEVDGRSVTMSGDGETVSLATWTDGDYSYSVYASGGLSQGDMAQLVSQVK